MEKFLTADRSTQFVRRSLPFNPSESFKAAQMSNSDLSKIRVEAKTSTLDMMIGPPVISAILSGVFTFAVARLIWSMEDIQKHLNILWLFPVFFVPLLFATFYYNLNRGRWLIENGIVYRGKTPLFRLDGKVKRCQVRMARG
jgi:hypothetical protein